MAKKTDYITDQEQEEAIRRFYNGLDYTEHIEYRESVVEQYNFNPRIVEDFLEVGERYTVLERGYVVTSYGRVFNLRFRRFLKPKFYNSDIYMYCGDANYRMEPTFKEMGWKFDKVEILKRYISNDWNRKVMDNCQYLHLTE